MRKEREHAKGECANSGLFNTPIRFHSAEIDRLFVGPQITFGRRQGRERAAERGAHRQEKKRGEKRKEKRGVSSERGVDYRTRSVEVEGRNDGGGWIRENVSG